MGPRIGFLARIINQEARKYTALLWSMDLNNWKYVRTIDPIESSFAILRHRTIRSKDYLSNSTALAIVFKLFDTARNAGASSTVPKLTLGVTTRLVLSNLPIPRVGVSRAKHMMLVGYRSSRAFPSPVLIRQCLQISLATPLRSRGEFREVER
jgi:hypothetical protein